MHKDHVDMLPYMAAFAVVVETGSFIDASEKLGVSASAVSRQISKLERILSLRLIERSTRHLKVNADGVKVYYHCKELLRFSSRVFDLKDELGQPQGLIKISAPKMMNSTLNQLMPEFLRRFPEINVQFIFDGGQGDLISDGVDLSIKITDSPPLGLVARKLFNVDFTVCATPEYINFYGVPSHPSELAGHSCIAIADKSGGKQWEFANEYEKVEVMVSGRYCSNDIEAVLKATLNNLGIACLPSAATESDLSMGRLITVLPNWKYVGSSQGMAWLLYKPNKHGSQRLKVLVDYLIENFYGVGC
jgi:DNA-binding transcriptional LysR family regulator